MVAGAIIGQVPALISLSLFQKAISATQRPRRRKVKRRVKKKRKKGRK